MNRDQFTDRAWEAIQLAEWESRRHNAEHVRTEHVLLGLLEGDGVAVAALGGLGVDRAKVRAEVAKLAGALPSPDTLRLNTSLPHSPRVRLLLDNAVEQARVWGCERAGTGHLLLGMICDDGSGAMGVLRSLGLTACGVEKAVLEQLEGTGGRANEENRPPAVKWEKSMTPPPDSIPAAAVFVVAKAMAKRPEGHIKETLPIFDFDEARLGRDVKVPGVDGTPGSLLTITVADEDGRMLSATGRTVGEVRELAAVAMEQLRKMSQEDGVECDEDDEEDEDGDEKIQKT